MKYILLIGLFAFQLCLHSQTIKYYSISGHIKDDKSNLQLGNCTLKLLSSTGLIKSTVSNDKGVYIFDSIPVENKYIELIVEKKKFFSVKKKFNYNVIPQDTIINFNLSINNQHGDPLPGIYFKYNSVSLQDNSTVILSELATFLEGNKNIKIKIVGYKDSIETKDMRYDRAKVVYNLIIKKGIKKGRLIIEVSDNPVFLYNEIYTETYIKNTMKEEQEKLRQFNRCVMFKIIEY
ncbi:MAG: OmpA family protein [Bacteroidales bacterium]